MTSVPDTNSGVAAAFTSSWTPTFSPQNTRGALPCRICTTPAPSPAPPPSPSPPSKTKIHAVIDNFKNLNNAHLPESVHSMHNRLGIGSLWSQSEEWAPATEADSIKSTKAAAASSPSSSPSPPTSARTTYTTTLSTHTTDAVSPHVSATDDDDTIPTTSGPIVMPWDTTTSSNVHQMSLLDQRFQSVRKRTQLVTRSYEECRRITALFSKTFYLGTSLLSPEKRRAVWAIYTWCRRTDDLVDGPRVTQRSSSLRDTLRVWERRLIDIFDGKARDALDLALVDAIDHFPDITKAPFLDMIKGMIMDVDQDRFDTFDDLYLYCYRVAGTVGLMTLPIMGTRQGDRDGLRQAVEPAVALGIGLQLTNILRDVGEDRLRGRIYLPLEDLKRFNYTEQDLFNCVLDARYVNLMKFQVARARRYFRQAERGVHLLAEDSRFPVQASLDMYSQILDVLEANGYDNFNRRAHISKLKKFTILPASLLKTQEGNIFSSTLLNAAEFIAASANK